jgi:hypothetical protein
VGEGVFNAITFLFVAALQPGPCGCNSALLTSCNSDASNSIRYVYNKHLYP